MARFDASEVRDQAAARAAAIAEKIEAFKSVGIEVPEHLQELAGDEPPAKVEPPVVEEPAEEPVETPAAEPVAEPVEEVAAEPFEAVESPAHWLDVDQDGPAEPVVEEAVRAPAKRQPRAPKKPGS